MRFLKIILICVVASSCTNDKTAVEREMRNYGHMILTRQYDSMVHKFMPHGELASEGQHSIFGRDSIADLFKSFAGATVIKYETTSKSVVFKGDDAIQDGSYMQVVTVPSGDTLELSGDYTAIWTKSKDGEWLIKKMLTQHYHNLKEEREKGKQ
jgi:ketosteroid isomerase-like protein